MRTLSQVVFCSLIILALVFSFINVKAKEVESTVRVAFLSHGIYDGYVRELEENSSIGGKVNNSANIFVLGDDKEDRQYVGILSFMTGKLPDNAIVTYARVRLQFTKADMMGWPGYGTEVFEVQSPYFGSSVALEAEDFQAKAAAELTGGGRNVNEYLFMLFGENELQYINLQGYTQVRIRLSLDDNDDLGADYYTFFTGDPSDPLVRPRLIVEYHLP